MFSGAVQMTLTFASMVKATAPAVVNFYTARVDRLSNTCGLRRDPECNRPVSGAWPALADNDWMTSTKWSKNREQFTYSLARLQPAYFRAAATSLNNPL